MSKNTQQPVARISLHRVDGVPRATLLQTLGGAAVLPIGEIDVYAAPVVAANEPVPRDVLIQALDDMMYHCACEWSNSDPDKMVELCRGDIELIADRYASQVQPEPVNQQLLVALNNVLDLFGGVSWRDLDLDGKPALDVVNEAHAAIAAAEAGRSQPVEQKPVGTVTLIQPHGLSATLLIERGAILKNGDELYSASQPATLPNQPVTVPASGHHAPPFAGCKFELCDLPGQCRSEGKCHHPAPQPVAVPDGWKSGLWRYGFKHQDFGFMENGPYVLLEQVELLLAAAPKPEGV